MSEVVVDSSALLAVVNREPGRQTVLRQLSDAVTSSVNLAEVVTKLVDQSLSGAEVDEALELVRCEITEFDEVQALLAGRLRAHTRHRGMSLGDRACLALASTLGLPVLTADRAWWGLEVGVEVRVIR